MTSARDRTNRLFILEQGGVIKILQPGATTPTVFLNITTKVLSGGEHPAMSRGSWASHSIPNTP